MGSDKNTHWLERPATIRGLWIGFVATLAVSVLAGFLYPPSGVLGWDEWPGFAAVFGFSACVVMVVVAKLLGFVLKRDERYYETDRGDD